MPSRTKTLLAPLLLLFAAGCVSASVIPLGERNLEPVPEEEVVVYESMDDLPAEADYRKVALIRAEADYEWDDREDLVETMREEAAKLGANAIVLRGFDDPTTGERIADAFLGVGAELTGECLALRLTPRGEEGEGTGEGAGDEEGGEEGDGGGPLPVIRVGGAS